MSEFWLPENQKVTINVSASQPSREWEAPISKVKVYLSKFKIRRKKNLYFFAREHLMNSQRGLMVSGIGFGFIVIKSNQQKNGHPKPQTSEIRTI